MTEALLVILLLGSMYLTARLYPKPPRYIFGPGTFYWVPSIVAFEDFNDSLKDLNEAFIQTSDSLDTFKSAWGGTVSGTWNAPGESFTVTDWWEEEDGTIIMVGDFDEEE